MMAPQRISLSRVVAINWYGFRQIIPIEGNGLIAGAFGTGKSALLDLMQYVLLGGDHWKPNRAAAGRGRGRTLVSYCLCDSNTERDSQPHYVRQSGVTIAALEFTWPGDKVRRETWGARIEYSSPTAEPKLTWFYIPDRLEWAALAPAGDQILDEDGFRTLVKRQLDGECFYRASQYLDEMATPNHLHFDRRQMNKTMPKALAFEPEDNFEKFIREFLLEPNPLDVREVRQSLGAHRDMQARLARLEHECGFLTRIAEKHQAALAAARQAALHAHAALVLRRAETAEKLTTAQSKLTRLQEKNTSDKLELDSATGKLASVTRLIEEVRLEASNDPDSRKLDELERRKKDLEREVADLRDAKRAVSERLNDRAYRWSNWLRHGDQLRLENLDLTVDSALLQSLRGESGEALEALGKLANRFNEIFTATGTLLQPLSEERKSAERKLQDLARELDAIDRKETPGAFPLFSALRQKLGGSFTRPPEQLCRLIEVKPAEERWWPALEAMLGRNRFAIIVSAEDYPAALDLLRRSVPGRESESLVNPAEARRLHQTVQPESLATKVDVADPIARAFVHSLLGGITCVETVEELDHAPTDRAITSEGIYKQVPTRRRLREDSERPFTLGKEGLERMRRERQRQQLEIRARRDALDQQIKDIHGWLDWGKQAGLSDPRLPERGTELPRLPALERELGTTIETIKLIATPEREARVKKLQELEKEKSQLDGRVALLAQSSQRFTQESRQLREQVESAESELRDAENAVLDSRIRLPSGLLDAELATFLEPWLQRRDAWVLRIQESKDRAAILTQEAALLRRDRNQLRRDLAEARDDSGAYLHPEYRFDIDPDEESNDRWDHRLSLLTAHELARHRQLAAEKKKEWEDRLKAQVLDKLNDRLREAELTVQQLRRQLDRDVGRYRYRIKHWRDPAMAAVWRLLDTGFEPTDELMAGIRNDEIERAKDELMRAVEAADQNQLDERATRLLDYRFYNRYDVIMEPIGQPGGASISLTRSIGKMSGGENQAPFFICMLAAFNRVYDVGSQRFRQNLSLVVMDEAFSKLSGDGIQDCLELARNFQLQLFMAVPIDRLGVMHNYAETTILCRKEEQRGPDGYVSRIDNIPIRLTAAQVREAIE